MVAVADERRSVLVGVFVANVAKFDFGVVAAMFVVDTLYCSLRLYLTVLVDLTLFIQLCLVLKLVALFFDRLCF